MSTSDLTELYLLLGRLESKVDALQDDKETVKEHEKRIAALERWRAGLAGAAALALLLAAHAADIITLFRR